MIPLPEGASLTNFGISKEEVKAWCIVRALFNYDADDVRDAVRIIEEQGVDKFDFDYPYGSFKEFKKHTLAGEFDVEDMSAMDEEMAECERSVKAGESYIIYENLMECKANIIQYPKKGQ